MIKGLAFANRLHQLDRWAMGLSGLCVAHCLASSIFFAVMASAGSVFLHPLVHEIGLVLAIMFGAISLGRGIMAHGVITPLAIGAVGLATMGFALTLPHDGSEALATIIGASILALGHYLNRRAFACSCGPLAAAMQSA